MTRQFEKFREWIGSKNLSKVRSVILAISATLIGIIYYSLNHFGVIDRITGHIYAVEGLQRLSKPYGNPVSWIYNDSTDSKHFNALFSIIKKNTTEEKIIAVLREGHTPTMITIGGQPIPIQGIDDDMPQAERFAYTDNHPIMLLFGVYREGDQKGKTGKACTLGDLKLWVEKDKSKWDYIIGGVALSLIGIIFIVLEKSIGP